MTIRSTPNNGGFQLSDVPFFSYYWFCLIKSFFIMTLRLRYQTFKNKPKHTGISSDIINKRSMGNLAYTILRFLCLVWKRAARLWRYGRFQWCALGLHSRYFHLKSRPCELFYFVDFLSLSRVSIMLWWKPKPFSTSYRVVATNTSLLQTFSKWNGVNSARNSKKRDGRGWARNNGGREGGTGCVVFIMRSDPGQPRVYLLLR